MSRITLEDNGINALIKMAEGNPGGLNVCMRILTEGEKIDPQNFLGGLGAVLFLDTLEIYGSRIWMLFKDVCREDLVSVIGVLRACQMGHLSQETLNHAIDNRGDGIDVEAELAWVRENLTEFVR